MKLMKVYDYIYYRLTKFYFKWDGEIGSTAIVGVSMIQTLLLADGALLIMKLALESEDYKPYSKGIATIIIAILVLFIIVNYLRYNGSYNRLHRVWVNETNNIKLIRGLMVVVELILHWVPIFLMGMYWK
jgi:hypothetical protein